uniref:Retrotransposon gag domain-containing protein n=1 Tax=Vitis vinifera TaxID=29760 RepID=A5B671_VITVI|nr:hypothetical protein VITISV_039019 [Vitis vinifera]
MAFARQLHPAEGQFRTLRNWNSNVRNLKWMAAVHSRCVCHIEYEIAEEAMNFMSYVAEVSRGWDEPNARDMGIMKSQPNAKGEIYILNDGIDMKAKIATMARRLEELEMKKMQEVQAISQTPLQAMPCAICLSYEHLVEECPTIPAVREMFGDCNTYNSNWRDHPNFSWKPQPPQYKQHVQATQQALNLEQAMVNLSKVVEDFVGAQKSINAHLSQRIDSVESSLNKRMDEVQNDLSHKIDNLQDSISRRKCKNDERKGREERILAIGSIATFGTYLEHLLKCEILSPRCEFSKHQFRTPLFKVRKISHHAKYSPGTQVPFRTPQATFRTVQTRCENFAHHNSRCEIHSNVRANSSAKILLLLDTFLKNFLELKLCISYLVSKLGKSGIKPFKRNPVLQTVRDLDLKRRSYGRLKTDYTKLSGNFAP